MTAATGSSVPSASPASSAPPASSASSASAAVSPQGSGPFAGLLVVDLTRVLAGPYCTMMLAELGARIIKVERPGSGDDARHIGPFVDGVSAYFASLNRGKESIALDLKTPADCKVLDALLDRADILVENFRPGIMARLGYGQDALHARWPQLICAAVSGFGQSGPYRDRPAYDMVVQAMGGVMSLTGHPGGAPVRVGSSIGDISAGLFTVIGIAAALHQRARTGRGGTVDVAMLDCQVAMLENAIARYHVSRTPPGPLGSRHPSIAPFQAFAVADGHIVIAAGNDSLFRTLAEALAMPEMANDPRFATNDLRCEHVDALTAKMEARLKAKPAAHWLETLGAQGVACGPINDIAAVVADPQVQARNMVVDAGGLPVAGNPVKMSGLADSPTRTPAPALDANRAAILQELKMPPEGA